MPHVVITTATELSSTQLSKIKKAIEKKHSGETATFDVVVDPQILGGIVMTVDSSQLDLSIKNKLGQLKQMLHESIALE